MILSDLDIGTLNVRFNYIDKKVYLHLISSNDNVSIPISYSTLKFSANEMSECISKNLPYSLNLISDEFDIEIEVSTEHLEETHKLFLDVCSQSEEFLAIEF